MSVKLSTRQIGDVTVIDATGRITLGEGSSTFRETIKDMLSKGSKKLLLNLADVSYIDSSGIGELVSGYTSVSNGGGSLKLLNLLKELRFEVTGHGSWEEAIVTAHWQQDKAGG